MNVVLLGPPGVGKGTYANVLSIDYNIPTISVGDLFRRAIKDETELGKRIKQLGSVAVTIANKVEGLARVLAV